MTKLSPSVAVALLLAFGGTLFASGVEDAPPLWGGLEPGPYAVGFAAEFVVDDTRSLGEPSAGEYRGRPIRIMIWYPALLEGGERPLRFGDYLRLEAPSPRFAEYNENLQKRDRSTARRQFSPTSPELVQRLEAARTGAYRGLVPAPGPFPLVLHSLGRNDYQLESTVLWEFLASHGYVVATVPQVPAHPERGGLRFELLDMQVQAADLGFALAHLVRRPGVDGSRLALLGHSSGGVAAALVAEANRNVDALVSLDGSLANPEIQGALEAAGWDPRSLTVPILDLHPRSEEEVERGAWKAMSGSTRYQVGLGSPEGFGRATHFDFQNWPLFAVLAGVEDDRAKEYRSPERGREVYLAVCRSVLYFLDGVLGGDAAKLRVIAGEAPLPGVDPGILELRVLRSGDGGARPGG